VLTKRLFSKRTLNEAHATGNALHNNAVLINVGELDFVQFARRFIALT